MAIVHDLLGTWSGVLTVIVIAFSAFAIPAGVIYALHREMKSPAELKAEKYAASKANH